jgi:hypothetical protein
MPCKREGCHRRAAKWCWSCRKTAGDCDPATLPPVRRKGGAASGAIGGASKSPAKTDAARRNLEIARRAKNLKLTP